MAKLQFGDLVTIIQSCEKKNEKSGSWIKQEVIINGIFSDILNLEIATRKNVDYEKYYVAATQCSQYFLCEKDIPKKIRTSLGNIPFDQLLGTTDNNLKKTSINPKPICQAIKKIYTDKKFIQIKPYQASCADYQLLDFNLLNQLYANEQFTTFLARVLLYTILAIPNTMTKGEDFGDIKKFSNDIEEFLLEKRFFIDYDRNIVIWPDIKHKTFKTITLRKYSSHFPNPNNDSSNSPSWCFSYTSPHLRDSLTLRQLVINGVNYTEKVECLLSEDDSPDAKYPYKKIFQLSAIPKADIYQVELMTEFASNFPLRTGFFKLHVPAKKLKCTIKIKGEKSIN